MARALLPTLLLAGCGSAASYSRPASETSHSRQAPETSHSRPAPASFGGCVPLTAGTRVVTLHPAGASPVREDAQRLEVAAESTQTVLDGPSITIHATIGYAVRVSVTVGEASCATTFTPQ